MTDEIDNHHNINNNLNINDDNLYLSDQENSVTVAAF